MQQVPVPPLPPVPPDPAIARVVGAGASEVLAGLRAQRDELRSQLSTLEEQREELTGQLDATPASAIGRAGIEARIKDIDQRIASLDGQIAQADAAVARAAAVPGAVVEIARLPRQGPPEEAFFLGGLFMVVVLFPLSIALARRWWRKGSAAPTTQLAGDLADRLTRIEQAVDAIAVEVERVGESQRFVARQFEAGGAPRALGAGAAEPIAVPLRNAERIERR